MSQEEPDGPDGSAPPPEPRGSERRRHTRYELMAQVRVRRGSVDYVLELVNISRSGALVSLGSLQEPRWLSIGRTVELSIIHPEALDTVDLTGRVVRIEEGARLAFAVEFDPPQPAEAAALDRLLAHALESTRPPPVRPPRPGPVGRQPPPLPRAPGAVGDGDGEQ
jgi:hypothetical protein